MKLSVIYSKHLGGIVRLNDDKTKVKFYSILTLNMLLRQYVITDENIRKTKLGYIITEPDLLWVSRFKFIEYCSDTKIPEELLKRHFDENIVLRTGTTKDYLKCIVNEFKSR